jgi:hypothetical protein
MGVSAAYGLLQGGINAAPALSGAALSYEEPTNLVGVIYGRNSDSQHPLYKFRRTAVRSGSTLKVEREFTYPDGKLAAKESLTYDAEGLASFKLEEMQIGAQGSATVRRSGSHPGKATLEFEYARDASSRGKAKVKTESWQDNTLVADMVGPFLIRNWAALSRGEKLKCRYIVVPREETVGFTFTKQSESTAHGRPVLIVKMEPTSFVIARLVDPLYFTIETAAPHRVLRYVGRTTPKTRVGDKWADLDAVTAFDWKDAK